MAGTTNTNEPQINFRELVAIEQAYKNTRSNIDTFLTWYNKLENIDSKEEATNLINKAISFIEASTANFSIAVRELNVDFVYQLAQVHEFLVSQRVKEAVEGAGCKLQGFEYRLKTRSSLARKLKSWGDEALSDDTTIQNANFWGELSSEIMDCLRFTAMLDVDSFVESYEKIMNYLGSYNYHIKYIRNTFGNKDNSYRGVNTNIINESGYVFELQFHTLASYNAKDEAHKYYEIVRLSDQYPPEEVDAALRKQEELFGAVVVPVNIEKIKNVA